MPVEQFKADLEMMSIEAEVENNRAEKLKNET